MSAFAAILMGCKIYVDYVHYNYNVVGSLCPTAVCIYHLIWLDYRVAICIHLRVLTKGICTGYFVGGMPNWT